MIENPIELHSRAASQREFQECLLSHRPEVRAALYNYEATNQRAVKLLLIGSISGLLGFLAAGSLGMVSYYSRGFRWVVRHNETLTVEDNYMGEPFVSGHNYTPQTVSELVHNRASPEGKAFFAFGLMGAVCILVSWYPSQLRNVYLGDKALCGRGPTWDNLRQYMPPLGMFLVACMPTVPPVNRSAGDIMTVCIHTLGALMMVGGYGVCEIVNLCTSQMDGSRTKSRFKPQERMVRATLIGFSLFFGIAFQISGLMSPRPVHSLGTDSCADVWMVPEKLDLDYVLAKGGNDDLSLAVYISQAIRDKRMMLYNTASGRCLMLKQMEYWFEVLSGLFMIASHLAVWWFCPERDLAPQSRLPNPRPRLPSKDQEMDSPISDDSDDSLID